MWCGSVHFNKAILIYIMHTDIRKVVRREDMEGTTKQRDQLSRQHLIQSSLHSAYLTKCFHTNPSQLLQMVHIHFLPPLT